MQPGVAIVFVAHGSRAEAANDAHRTMAEALGERLDVEVRAAFLELAEPSIPDAIDAVASEGAERILVLPHFLYPGRHVTEDVPALVTGAAGRLPGTKVELLGATGDELIMADLLVSVLWAALRHEGPAV